jgi:hypothetical protein
MAAAHGFGSKYMISIDFTHNITPLIEDQLGTATFSNVGFPDTGEPGGWSAPHAISLK